MKKVIIYFIVMFLFPFIADAAMWCMWDGSKGQYSQSDDKGYLKIPGDYPDRTLANNKIIGGEAVYNANGFFALTTTHPALGVNQIEDQEIWNKTGNQVSVTWTVRDMTQTEIDQQDAEPMPSSEYYLWKILYIKGVITLQEIQDNLPQELKDAYLARDRLLNP